MSISDMLRDVPISDLLPVRQLFDREHITDIPSAVQNELNRQDIIDAIRLGMTGAITADSRGVAPKDVTMIRIHSTLDMDVIPVSQNLLPHVSDPNGIEILSNAEKLIFNEVGDLF